MNNAIQPILAQIAEKNSLTYEQSARAFQIVMSGGATPAQIAALLMGLRIKGETPEEIAGGAEAIRAKAAPFRTPPGAMDTCGTGGDGSRQGGTLNVSTAVAIALAACGVPVAKHGNRAVSSKSGSADVFEALGVKIDAAPAVMEKALAQCNLCFLFAPLYHKAMRHVAPIRQELGLRTVFNLLGPLSNPARPAYQLLGVYAPQWVEPMAQGLKRLGTERAWVVHGRDGMDELSVSTPSLVAELADGSVSLREISPEDAGLQLSPPQALQGGDIAYNVNRLRNVLLGEQSPYRDAVVLNTAAGLVITGKAPGLREGTAQAAEALDSGAANAALQRFVALSRTSM